MQSAKLKGCDWKTLVVWRSERCNQRCRGRRRKDVNRLDMETLLGSGKKQR